MARRKPKKLIARLFLVIIFLIGAAVLAFPIVSQYLYYQAAQTEVQSFQSGVAELAEEEIDERLFLAEAYNAALLDNTAMQGVIPDYVDPYSQEEKQEGVAEYARMLEVNELMGMVRIPKISQQLPIYAGTSEKVLQQGVGHLEATSLPIGGNSTHSILTAHRGLPTARLFTDLDKLELGDYFYIENIFGTLAYQVDDIKVIEPHEVEALAIVPGHDYVTLLTCTPYMINTHRLLVRGHQVPYVEAVEENQIASHNANNLYRNLFFITLGILILVLLIILISWLKRRRKRKNRGATE